MHRARAFFYVCSGIFLLALSYHLGASNAGAQAPGNPIVAMCGITNGGGFLEPVAVTSSGDVYRSGDGGGSWQLRGNVFGGPTSLTPQTMSQLKARYR